MIRNTIKKVTSDIPILRIICPGFDKVKNDIEIIDMPIINTRLRTNGLPLVLERVADIFSNFELLLFSFVIVRTIVFGENLFIAVYCEIIYRFTQSFYIMIKFRFE